LRNEAASWRTKLREAEEREKQLQTQLKEHERSQLSDQEKVAAELEETKTARAEVERQLALSNVAVRESLLEADTVKAAVHPELGIIDPDAAFRLLDRSSIEWDDDTGRATNLPEVLKALVEARPYLQGSTEPGRPTVPKVDPTNPQRQPPPNVPTREDLKGMTTDQINEMWESGLLVQALEEGTIK
jgi:hypothetical protein